MTATAAVGVVHGTPRRIASASLTASTLTMLLPITRRSALSARSRPHRRGWLAALTAVGAALALAACRDGTAPVRPALPEGAPDELRFSMGGFGVTSTVVELRDDTLVVWGTPWDWTAGMSVDTARVVPTTEAWRAFWAAAERAGMRQWRPQYRADGVVDGVGWGVRVVADGRLIQSSGSNAFPDRYGREHELAMTDDFRAFLAALEELLGRPLL